MLGTVLDARCTVSVFAVGILLPFVLDWIIPLHRGTFLFANAVVIKIAAGQAVRLLGSSAASRAEQMAALSGL